MNKVMAGSPDREGFRQQRVRMDPHNEMPNAAPYFLHSTACLIARPSKVCKRRFRRSLSFSINLEATEALVIASCCFSSGVAFAVLEHWDHTREKGPSVEASSHVQAGQGLVFGVQRHLDV